MVTWPEECITRFNGQVQDLFGGYFNYADYRFAYTFPEIVAAGDFYNWSNGQRVGLLSRLWQDERSVLSCADFWDNE